MINGTIRQINTAIEDYFKKNPKINKVPAKDLMPLFVAKGIFPKDEKGGLPIRNLLRKLDKAMALNSIPYVTAERKKINTKWFFERVSHTNIVIDKSAINPVSKAITKKIPAINQAGKFGFPPIVSSESRVLILGSLPGDESLLKGEYYAKATNQFWKLMDAVIGDMPETYSERKIWLLKNKIAIWDVLLTAERNGSLDSSIKKGVPNDFTKLYKKYTDIKYVFFNGMKAQKDYIKYVGANISHVYHLLPSSSGANPITWENKYKEWEVIKSAINKKN